MDFGALLHSDGFRLILMGVVFFVALRLLFGLMRGIVIAGLVGWLVWHFWLA